jgi:hypothetical protein
MFIKEQEEEKCEMPKSVGLTPFLSFIDWDLKA